MSKNIHAKIYDRLIKLIPDLDTLPVGTAFRMKAEGFMDLSVEVLDRDTRGRRRISLSHYGEQNGDLMADPDMEVSVIPSMKMAEALTFRNDYVGVYQEVYPEPGKVRPAVKRDANAFLLQWLANIQAQGHARAKEAA